MSLRILHTADWHLGDRLASQDRLPDQLARLEEIGAQLDEHAADVLLVCGDVLEETRRERLAEIFGALAELLAPRIERGLQCVFLAGNSDSEHTFPLLTSVQTLLGPEAAGRVRFISEPTLVPLEGADGEHARAAGAAVPHCHALRARQPLVRVGRGEAGRARRGRRGGDRATRRRGGHGVGRRAEAARRALPGRRRAGAHRRARAGRARGRPRRPAAAAALRLRRARSRPPTDGARRAHALQRRARAAGLRRARRRASDAARDARRVDRRASRRCRSTPRPCVSWRSARWPSSPSRPMRSTSRSGRS